MSAFTQKGLEALNQAWVDNESNKYDAEKRAGLAEAQNDSYALAAAFQDYADADAAQHNLMSAYQRAEANAQAAQTVPRPVNEAEQLQRDVWEQIRTGNQQWDTYLTNRWRAGEAVAKGARPESMNLGNHVPAPFAARGQ